MATYILFWNPAISSYTMERFQDDFAERDQVGNWSFHEFEKVRQGDRFYMVRCGEGRTGVVMQGLIESKCYEDEDWSPKRRKPIYYADIWAHITVNPETAPKLLTPEELTEAIPDFNWYGGHSGRLLDKNYAEILDKMWVEYIDRTPGLFPDNAWISNWGYSDILKTRAVSTMLTKLHGKSCAICGYNHEKVFGKEACKKGKLKMPFSIRPELFDVTGRRIFRICNNCCIVPHDILVQKLSELNGE